MIEEIDLPHNLPDAVKIGTVTTQYQWYSPSALYCPNCGAQSLRKHEPQGMALITPSGGYGSDHLICIGCGKFIAVTIRDPYHDTEEQTLAGLRLIAEK